MVKLLSLIPILNPKAIAGVLGLAQAFIKFAKELLTLIIDVLFPVIPSEKFHKIIEKIRKLVNKIDGWLQKVKDFFLKVGE